MFDSQDKVGFFEKCHVGTSNFNAKHASQNIDWLLIRDMYNNAKLDNKHTMPKIIHFIWLGQPLPEWYQKNIEDWGVKNPEFEIKIWSNENSLNFIQDKKSYQIFANSKSFGLQSDVLRYEILKEYGGIYLDTDFLCLSDEFNILHDNFSFYAGVSFEQNVVFFNGLIGCCPNHPILDLCIDNVSGDNTYMHIACPHTRVLHQTGPYLFTRCALSHLKTAETRGSIILPAQTFYPFPSKHRDHADKKLIQSFIKPWSMACHLWHSSWQPRSKFYAGEMM